MSRKSLAFFLTLLIHPALEAAQGVSIFEKLLESGLNDKVRAEEEAKDPKLAAIYSQLRKHFTSEDDNAENFAGLTPQQVVKKRQELQTPEKKAFELKVDRQLNSYLNTTDFLMKVLAYNKVHKIDTFELFASGAFQEIAQEIYNGMSDLGYVPENVENPSNPKEKLQLAQPKNLRKESFVLAKEKTPGTNPDHYKQYITAYKNNTNTTLAERNRQKDLRLGLVAPTQEEIDDAGGEETFVSENTGPQVDFELNSGDVEDFFPEKEGMDPELAKLLRRNKNKHSPILGQGPHFLSEGIPTVEDSVGTERISKTSFGKMTNSTNVDSSVEGGSLSLDWSLEAPVKLPSGFKLNFDLSANGSRSNDKEVMGAIRFSKELPAQPNLNLKIK